MIIYIIDNENRNVANYQNIFTHEMGHALGFMGHTGSTSSVMYHSVSEISSLTISDKSELQQVYN